MNPVLAVLGLALVWIAATGALSLANLVLGALVAGVAVLVLRARMAPSAALGRARAIAGLFAYLCAEILIGALRVARLVLDPGLRRRRPPAIVAVPIALDSARETALLCHMLTLTPGMLGADLSEDGTTLYVHVLALGDEAALIETIKSGFEARIGKAFGDVGS